MSLPPPGLGGGAARAGPPPGFGTTNSSGLNPPTSAGGIGGGTRNTNGTASIVKAQIVFLLTTLTDETFEKASKDLRELASSNGPEMYYHLLNRICMVANPYIQGLSQHFQQYKEDPAAPPHQLPTHGAPAVAWRLLVSEAARAARDVDLAPQFVYALMSPMNSTCLPIPSLRLFGLPPQFLFSLAAYALAAPKTFPSSQPSHKHVDDILYQAYDGTLAELHAAPGSNFWTYQLSANHAPFSEDLSMQEARTLLLAIYPRSTPFEGANSRPPTPTNPTAPHPALLDTYRRAGLIQGLNRKFQSTALVLQTLTSLSPGGPPRSPESIPLEHMIFELAELMTDDQAVEAVIQRWWRPWILESDDLQLRNLEMTRTLHGLLECLSKRPIGAGIHKVVEVLAEIPGVAWPDVVKSFDLPGLVTSPHAVALLTRLILSTPQTPVPAVAGLLPASIDAPLWENTNSLLMMVKGITDKPPDHFPIFTMRESSHPSSFARVVDPPSHTSTLPERAQNEAEELQCAGIYNSMGFIVVIVAVFEMGEADESNTGLYDAVQIASLLLDTGLQVAPELVILGLEKLGKPLPGRAHVARETLWHEYLAGNHEGKSTTLVFHQLWESNSQKFMERLLEFYNENATRIDRVVRIAEELNILGMLIDHQDTQLALDVAAVVSEKELLDLESWLADGIEAKGDDHLQSIFDFVENKIRDGFARRDRQFEEDEEDEFACRPLSAAVYSIFIRVIRNAQDLSPEDVTRFRRMRTDILILHPSLLNLYPGSKEEQGFTETKPTKDQAIQYEDYYQPMYDGEVTVDERFQDLKRMHASSDSADHEFFSGCLHLLFDEFKWLDRYPPKQLAMTSVLFGTLIDSRIIKDIPAFVATRYLLDACKTDITKPTYSFGVYALSALRGSLVDFPGLCRSLKEIDNLRLTHPGLVTDIDNALAERDELDSQGGVKLAFPALRLPIMVEEGVDEFIEPESKKKDAIMFIINQIAPSNYEQKSRDLLDLFEDQYSRWFANYFIEVRVSLEQNRHEIYMNIIDLLNSPVLERHILWETYRKTRDLINADATMSSSSQRASLKTIALWLGRITLARNKPIRMRELSVKDILIQGYDNKRLIVAIPFVCNLLASCKESIVFHLPNPWLSAMLGLLVEIYTLPEVRLNLKFEIEVLFTKLAVALNAVEPSTILRNRIAPSQPQGDAPDRLEQEYRKALAEMLSGTRSDGVRMRTVGGDGEPPAETNEWFLQRTEELLAHLPDAMVFTPDFPFFQMNSAKRAVHDATSLAIREMISPVVERSVTIAGISTRDLLAKDFSTEADSAKLRHAAQLMVKNLAGNLAMVTCKDPLRERMTSSIRAALVAAGYPESGLPDHIVSGIVDDNLEAATAVLKSLTVDKASKDIDVNLAAHFASRRDHHDARSNQHFIDSASVAIALPQGALPNILRMIPGGLLPPQLRVYEDFAEQPVEPPRVYAANGHGRNREAEHDRTGYQQELDSHTRRPSPRPRTMSIQEAVHSFQELAIRVDQLIASTPARSLSELSGEHPLRSCIASVIHLINQVAPADQPPAALGIAQKVVQLLYRSDLNLGRETYVTMLQSMCEFSAIVDKEVKDWLVHAEDARKLNVPVTITLIQVNMIAIQELDRRMSQMLSRNTLDRAEVEFVTELLREISTGDSPMSSRNAFVHTLTSMLKLQENGMSDRGIDSLLSSLRRSKIPENTRAAPRHTPVPEDNGEPVVIDEKKQAQLKHFFLDWVRTYQTSSNVETAFRPYITYLHDEGILIGEDITTAFYKMAIHVAVDSFGQIGQEENASIGTDSLAKLMVLIVKNQYNNNRATVPDLARSSYYFRKIITILSYCLIERHMELGDKFDQRPWTRIFTSLLSELYQLGEQFSPLRRGCLRVLAKVLGTTQPVYAPRFAFGWMSIVSHRSFMPLLLFDDIEGSWSDYHKCLMWLLRFAEPFLKLGEMTHSSRSMYRGICRLFCVLMHDFPEFLDEYYHSFTTAIPPNCVQLRNICLSAFPVRDGPLPDPHRGLDHLLPEMQRYPIVRADYAEALEAGGIKAAIDQHVHNGMPGVDTIVAELRNRIAVKTLSADGPVITWNRTLLHAAVYYLGTSCIARIGEQTGIVEFNHGAAEVTILAHLALSLDGEGQYYLLSVVADQLRYPSAHTYFYISFMLYLFVFTSRIETRNSIPDRIGRVLLERIIVQRPHPFGLLVCFVELMEDQQYEFWHQPFAQAPGELHEIFLRVQKNIVRARDDDMDRRAQKQLQAMNEGEDSEYRSSP